MQILKRSKYERRQKRHRSSFRNLEFETQISLQKGLCMQCTDESNLTELQLGVTSMRIMLELHLRFSLKQLKTLRISCKAIKTSTKTQVDLMVETIFLNTLR